MALPERGRLGHSVLPGEPDHRRQLRGRRSGVDLAGRQLRTRGGLSDEVHPDLHRRGSLYGGGPAPHRGCDRPRDGRDALDVPGAAHDALGALYAPELRQGRRLRRGRWSGRDLLHLPRLLPACVGCEDRPAARGLRLPGAARGLCRDRSRGPAARPPRGLGTLAGLGSALRSGLRDPAGARLHHHLFAPDRGERRRGGGELRGAGLQPDPHRERAGRYPRLRCQDRRLQVEVPRHPAAGRGRPRDLAQRRVAVDRGRLIMGSNVRGP